MKHLRTWALALAVVVGSLLGSLLWNSLLSREAIALETGTSRASRWQITAISRPNDNFYKVFMVDQETGEVHMFDSQMGGDFAKIAGPIKLPRSG